MFSEKINSTAEHASKGRFNKLALAAVAALALHGAPVAKAEGEAQFVNVGVTADTWTDSYFQELQNNSWFGRAENKALSAVTIPINLSLPTKFPTPETVAENRYSLDLSNVQMIDIINTLEWVSARSADSFNLGSIGFDIGHWEDLGTREGLKLGNGLSVSLRNSGIELKDADTKPEEFYALKFSVKDFGPGVYANYGFRW